MRISRIGFNQPAVVVMGAGATRGADFVDRLTGPLPPLDTDFFTQAQRLSREKPRKLLEEVIKQTVDTFGHNFDLSMEGYFTMVEQLSNVLEDYRGTGRPRLNEYKSMHDGFLQVLAAVLDEAVGRRRQCSHHRAIVDAMGPQDTILSFNYDWLVDYTLKLFGKGKWNPRIGYGVPVHLSGSKGKGSEFWAYHEGVRAKYPLKTIELLKMHGSLNWFPVKTREAERKAGRGRKKKKVEVVSKLRLRQKWWHQYGNLKFEIAPPEWNKPIRSGVYRRVWRRARAALKVAKALVFIGYSLPETDMPARALFMVDRSAPNLNLLVTVNPDQGARRRIRRTLQHRLSVKTRVLSFEKFRDFAAFLRATGQDERVPPCQRPGVTESHLQRCPVAQQQAAEGDSS